MLGMALAPFAAGAHGGHRHHPPHGRIGFYFGYAWPAPFPAYVYPPYYVWPPTVIVRPVEPPTVYIERGMPQSLAQSEAVWYYCRSAQAYYPYVKDCPGGWERVVPTPPPH